MAKQQVLFRSAAFQKQSGKCFYCGLPMWQDSASDFASRLGISEIDVALLKCTAEHLTALQDKGKTTAENIAAACLGCNRMRHQEGKSPSPQSYRKHVQVLMKKGKFHSPKVVQRLLKVAD